MKKKKIYFLGIILGTIIICTVIFLGYFISIATTKAEGITCLKEKNYTTASNKFNEILSKDSNNSGAIALESLTQDCISLSNSYNSKDFQVVIEDYNKIKDNSNFALIKDNIDEMYNTAVSTPNFKLRYTIYGSEAYLDNKYYEDGSGELLFGSHTKDSGITDAYTVEEEGPSTNALFQIENLGTNPAEDLVLNLKFNNIRVELNKANSDWVGKLIHDKRGLWSTATYTFKDKSLNKDEPVQILFNFTGAVISPNASIDVTLSSKNGIPKEFTIPVKVKQA
jgi:hypothetical protein